MSTAQVVVTPVPKSTIIIASTIGLLISLALLYIFYRVMVALWRLKKAGQEMSKLDATQLRSIVGNDEDTKAIKDGSDNFWINLTLIGLVIAYGLGSVLGAVGSIAQLYQAIVA